MKKEQTPKKKKEIYLSPTGTSVYVSDRIVEKSLIKDEQTIRYNVIEKNYEVNFYEMIQSNLSKVAFGVSEPIYGDFTDDDFKDTHETKVMLDEIEVAMLKNKAEKAEQALKEKAEQALKEKEKEQVVPVTPAGGDVPKVNNV